MVTIGVAVLVASCSGESGSRSSTGASSASAESRERTARAHAFVEDLAGDDREAIQAAVDGLRRSGPEAVPALIQAVQSDYPTRVKVLSLDILGQLGVSAISAVPFLEELHGRGPGQLPATAKTALSRIRTWTEYGFGDLPENVEVHFVGRDRGQKELDIDLAENGPATTGIEVVVDRTEFPVVLVLTAKDPVGWTVRTSSNTQLAGVILSGHSPQALVEAPSSVPHRIHMSDEEKVVKPFHAATEEEATQAERMVLRLTGHRIDQFHGAPAEGPVRIGG
jgi:hypothetical protein